MATNTIPSPCLKSHLTRRAALQGAAAVGALALPAGVALAVETTDADPGLAAIEAGYRRFQEIQAECARLDQIADEFRARAGEAIAPMLPPEPAIPPELAPYSHWNEGLGKKIVWWGTTPRKGKVGKIGEAHMRAEIEWRNAESNLLAGQPDYERSGEIEGEREGLYEAALVLRDEVLATPARSARGVLIKMAIGAESRTLQGIEAALDDCHWPIEALLPPVLADLRAMAGRAVA